MSHQVSVSLAITDVTQFSLIPGGGTSLSSGQDFLLEDWARDIIKQQSFSSPSQWASWVLACRGLLTKSQFEYLLRELVAISFLGKNEVILLYRMQSPEVRTQSPYLTIEGMWKLHVGGITSDDIFPVRENGSQLFTKEELLILANEYVTISPHDVRMFLRGWFYRDENLLSLPFLTYWYTSDSGYLDGKDKALLAITYYEKKRKTLSKNKGTWRRVFFREIQERVANLARSDPESHGLPGYISLLYALAQDTLTKAKRREMEEQIADIIAHMIIEAIRPEGRCSLYQTQTLLYFQLSDPMIPSADKKKILEKVNHACKEFASQYMSFVSGVEHICQ